MKRFSNYIFIFSIVGLTFSCVEPDEPALSGEASLGGLLTVSTPSLSFNPGAMAEYTLDVIPFQSGSVTTKTIDVFATFSTVERDAAGAKVLRDENKLITLDEKEGSTTALTTNQILLGTMTAPKDDATVSLTVDYATLSAGIIVPDVEVDGQVFPAYNGGALPAAETDLLIGDRWTVTFISTLSNGTKVENGDGAAIGVAARFAGNYELETGQYWRANALESFAWLETFTVESIDATTYLITTWALWDDQELYFQIDASTNAISYPATDPSGAVQQINDLDVITCAANSADLPNVPCSTSNVATADPDGHDKLDMIAGYIGGTGSREFWKVIVKP
jgi:hypothetical protein